jgi:hypothetical protein
LNPGLGDKTHHADWCGGNWSLSRTVVGAGSLADRLRRRSLQRQERPRRHGQESARKKRRAARSWLFDRKRPKRGLPLRNNEENW